jgi:uncharacterized membrane protein YcaP (DUF421 family)
MEYLFFWNGWYPLLRIVVVGTLAYFSVVLILRSFGKRTLGSMNAFDFVTTVAMGAVFGGSLIDNSVTISETLVAFGLLVALQYAVSFIEVRVDWFSSYITTKPTLLYYRGHFYKQVMQRERVHKRDILGMVRKNGFGSLDDVEAIILETDGSFSVIQAAKSHSNQSAYTMVQNFTKEG